jgi:nitroreductase
MNAWKQDPLRYWKNSTTDKQEHVKNALITKYADNSQNQRDEAIRSCGFAGQTIMLAAKQMGLDSCPMVGFEYDELAKIINLPEDHLIVLMIVVGKAAEPASPRGGQLPLDEVVFENKF